MSNSQNAFDRGEGLSEHTAPFDARGGDGMCACDRDFARFPDPRIRDPLMPTLPEPAARAYRCPLTPRARRDRR